MCIECGKKFVKYDALRRHLEIHINGNKWQIKKETSESTMGLC
jgi:predicted transcriptional regulator